VSVERALPSAGSARSSEAPLLVNNNDSCQATALLAAEKRGVLTFQWKSGPFGAA